MIVGIFILLAAAFALGLFVGYLVWHPANMTVSAATTPAKPNLSDITIPPNTTPPGDISDIAKKLAEEYKK